MRQHVHRDDQADDHAESEGGVFDEEPPDFTERCQELFHAIACLRLAAYTAIAAAARNPAMRPRSSRSAPSQGKRRPSPIQNTPNADSRTPTANFSVFSGTLD